VPEQKNITVDLAIPEGKQISEVQLLSPDWSEDKILDHKINGGKINFNVPVLKTFGLVVVKIQ
jgi:hypothetical protein